VTGSCSFSGSCSVYVSTEETCLLVLTFIVVKFWNLSLNRHLWALLYASYICNFGYYAQDACLNYVDVPTVVIPLLF
jgi:hypothetical protein